MDLKISQLGATTTPASPDLFAIVQGGVTKKITFSNLAAAISSGGTSLSAGTIPYWDGSEFQDSWLSRDTNSVILATTKKIRSSVSSKSELDFGASGDEFNVFTDGGTGSTALLLVKQTFVSLSLDGNQGIDIAPAGTLIRNSTLLQFDSPLYQFDTSTASTVPYFDASKNLVSSSVTPTELGYVSGATSNLQDQIDAISGTTYTGTANRIVITGTVIDIGTDVVTLAGLQTLTNKTLTSPIVGTSLNATYATVSTVAVFDGSKNLVSSGVTATTLSYLDVTSSIQTQLDSKALCTVFFQGLIYSPADNTRYYMDASGRSVSTIEAVRKFKIEEAGTVKTFVMNTFQNTLASSESVTIYIRNVTTATDYLVGTYSFTTASNSGFTFSGLSIPINTSDLYTVVVLPPTYTTNPTGVYQWGHFTVK